MTDEELVSFVSEFREGILNGVTSTYMCAMVCMPLVTLLRLHGVEAEIVESDLGFICHVWLRLPDGRALDPTADQFQSHPCAALGYLDLPVLPPVYLGPPLSVHANPVPFQR